MARVLALLNGRARHFRFSALHLRGADTIVFDSEDVGATPVTVSPPRRLHEFVVRAAGVWWTEDASADERLAGMGTVPGCRSYAGVPLVDRQGAVFGVLCHFDDGVVRLGAPDLDVLVAAGRELSSWWPTAGGSDAEARITAQTDEAPRAAAKLKVREEWLSTTLASIGDAVIATDTRGRVTYMNRVAVTLTGWSDEEAVGRSLSEVFPIFNETTRAPVESPVDKVLREGAIVGLANHTVLRHRRGQLIPIEDSAAPIREADGPMSGVVLVFRDATELRRIEMERDRLFDEERTARERLQALITIAPIAIVTWRGPRHILETVNAVAHEYLGRGPELLDLALADVVNDLAEVDTVVAVFDKVYRTGVPYFHPEMPITLRRPGGSETRFYAVHLTPLRAANNETSGLMASAADVTSGVRARETIAAERDRANALALSEAKARLRSDFLLTVAESLGGGLELEPLLQRLVDAIAPGHADFASIWTVDLERAIRRAAHAPYQETVVRPDGAPKQFSSAFPIQQVADTGQPLVIADLQRYMPATGSPEHAKMAELLGLKHALYVPIVQAKRVTGVLAVGRRTEPPFSAADVAVYESVARQAALAFDNSRLHLETVRLRTAAETATVSKDHFLARVSHDLRNPLGSILGWATLLREQKPDPAQLAMGLEVIERNAQAQAQLIEDLLDVSRITSGEMQLEIATHNVQEAIDVALDNARLTAAAKKVRLAVAVEQDIGSIAVDSERFRQVVWNLASNAVKFTPTGGTVNVSARRIGSELRVVVQDNGRGIAPELLPRVFDAFERAERTGHRADGLGLGLAIVRQIVELHHGTVEVESEGVDRGARFTVRLPIVAAVWPSKQNWPSSKVNDTLAGVKVLVVDDEKDAREVVAAILKSAGAAVVQANSVDQAWAVFEREKPDAIVSDIEMPGKDGKALIRKVRGLPDMKQRTVVAVALTALSRLGARVEILLAGFNTHVLKPVEPEELVLVLAGLLQR